MVVFLLFIIACAVAPQAIINICRFIEWCVKALILVFATVASIGVLGYIGTGLYHKYFT